MIEKKFPKPGYLNLKLTDKCNMNCKMCGQVYSELREQQNSLDFEKLKQRIKETPSIGGAYIFGGEPFMYKEIEPLMQFLTENDIAMDMTTNGLLLDRYIDTIFNYNFNSISISIDTIDRYKYKEIRGIDSFDIVVKNIKKLLQKKADLNLPRRPYINVNCVLLKENIDEIEDFYHYFYQELPNVTAISFEMQISMSQKIGDDYSSLMERNFQCDVSSWKWFHDKTTLFSEEEIERLYEKIQWLKLQDKASFMVPTDFEQIKSSFTEEYQCSNKICFRPFTMLSILPNGDVTFCVDFPDYILGNIYESSICDIWYTDRAKKFQEYLLNDNIPICARCPHRY